MFQEVDESDLITLCPSCGEMFDTDKRRPFQLDCPHDVCSTCLQRISTLSPYVGRESGRRGIRCPTCRCFVSHDCIHLDRDRLRFLIVKSQLETSDRSRADATASERATESNSIADHTVEFEQLKTSFFKRILRKVPTENGLPLSDEYCGKGVEGDFFLAYEKLKKHTNYNYNKLSKFEERLDFRKFVEIQKTKNTDKECKIVSKPIGKDKDLEVCEAIIDETSSFVDDDQEVLQYFLEVPIFGEKWLIPRYLPLFQSRFLLEMITELSKKLSSVDESQFVRLLETICTSTKDSLGTSIDLSYYRKYKAQLDHVNSIQILICVPTARHTVQYFSPLICRSSWEDLGDIDLSIGRSRAKCLSISKKELLAFIKTKLEYETEYEEDEESVDSFVLTPLDQTGLQKRLSLRSTSSKFKLIFLYGESYEELSSKKAVHLSTRLDNSYKDETKDYSYSNRNHSHPSYFSKRYDVLSLVV